jgi:hypothetical protein
METRTLVLVGLGFLIGSYFFNRRKKATIIKEQKPIASLTKPDSEKTGQELADEAKLKICKENWIKFSSTRRFASAEAMQNTYDNFMSTCVSQA